MVDHITWRSLSPDTIIIALHTQDYNNIYIGYIDNTLRESLDACNIFRIAPTQVAQIIANLITANQYQICAQSWRIATITFCAQSTPNVDHHITVFCIRYDRQAIQLMFKRQVAFIKSYTKLISTGKNSQYVCGNYIAQTIAQDVNRSLELMQFCQDLSCAQ